MFNEKDIYSHLVNGGNIKDLYKALENEIHNAQDRIIKEKDAELKQKELANRINDARKLAVAALKDYFALVNPDVTADIINSVLDTLETIEVKINGVRGKHKDCGACDGIVNLTNEEWKQIWNTIFPFHSKRK